MIQQLHGFISRILETFVYWFWLACLVVHTFFLNAQESFTSSSVLRIFCVFVPKQEKVIRGNTTPLRRRKVQFAHLIGLR